MRQRSRVAYATSTSSLRGFMEEVWGFAHVPLPHIRYWLLYTIKCLPLSGILFSELSSLICNFNIFSTTVDDPIYFITQCLYCVTEDFHFMKRLDLVRQVSCYPANVPERKINIHKNITRTLD